MMAGFIKSVFFYAVISSFTGSWCITALFVIDGMGVWERAPKTNRLHFHGLFNIPDGTMPGEIIEVKDYDTKAYKMQTSYQNTYFNERFGRSDFKEINPYEYRLGNAISYLIKYLEKSNEKIVYSKNLPMYFVSDILEEDIIC